MLSVFSGLLQSKQYTVVSVFQRRNLFNFCGRLISDSLCMDETIKQSLRTSMLSLVKSIEEMIICFRNRFLLLNKWLERRSHQNGVVVSGLA